MLSVGSVAILSQNMRSFASEGMGRQLGYNAIVQSPQSAPAIRAADRAVAGLPGIESVTAGAVTNSAAMVSVDGKDVHATLQAKVASHVIESQQAQNILYDLKGIEARDLHRTLGKPTMIAGRALDARDTGTNHIVVFEDLKHVGVKLGSTLVFADGGRHASFTVVGILSGSSASMMANNIADLTYLKRAGLTTAGPSHFALLYVNMDSEVLQKNLATLRKTLPGMGVIDLSNFTAMINKAIDKMELFPIIIGALALFAGVVIIANTVALAMLERRREIAVMKAVGAKRRSVIHFLLVENAVVGFIGAGAGVLLAMVATALVDSQFLQITASYDWVTITGLLVLGMVLSMGASALSALPASSERPMNVLRYE
jgi:ABC-type antimicrobial peptide transport system permease subunit